MDKKIKRYQVLPSQSGVYAISLVDDPAVESNFIALSKQEPMKFKVHDEERRIVYGCALRADFDIYRCYGAEEFYISFGKDAIRRLMTKFMREHLTNNWTVDHMDMVSGLTVVESWLVEDVENDKAKALGLTDFSEGSWMIGCKVDDDEIWHSIKEGRWKGFSVEAFIDMEEIEREIKNKRQHNSNMTKKVETAMAEIKRILMGAMDETEVKEVVDEVVDKVEEETETTEETIEVLEDVVEELEDKADEATEEMSEEEEVAQEVVDVVEDANDTEEGAEEDLQAVIDGLKEEIEVLKEENEELKKQNQRMAKMPSTKVTVKQAKQTGVKGAFSVLKAQGFIS